VFEKLRERSIPSYKYGISLSARPLLAALRGSELKWLNSNNHRVSHRVVTITTRSSEFKMLLKKVSETALSDSKSNTNLTELTMTYRRGGIRTVDLELNPVPENQPRRAVVAAPIRTDRVCHFWLTVGSGANSREPKTKLKESSCA